jgi:hypothetical protein
MNEFSSIRLPAALHSHAQELRASGTLDEEQFAVQQAEFIKALFGYVAYLRDRSRETPVADVFLSTFVNLLETLEANASDEARGCAMKLLQIIPVIFPGLLVASASGPAVVIQAVQAIQADGAAKSGDAASS